MEHQPEGIPELDPPHSPKEPAGDAYWAAFAANLSEGEGMPTTDPSDSLQDVRPKAVLEGSSVLRSDQEEIDIDLSRPVSPERFHDWIIEEIGDIELAARVAARPDLTRQLIEGAAIPSEGVFKMIQEIAQHDRKLAMKLVEIAAETGHLIPLSYSRIEGLSSDEEQRELLLNRRFAATHGLHKRKQVEREMTKVERDSVDFANATTNEYRLRYGQPVYGVADEQVRVYEKERLGNVNGDTIGKFRFFDQDILMANKERSDISTLGLATHEMFHLKGYGAAQAWIDEHQGKRVAVLRSGLRVHEPFSKKKGSVENAYLNTLNEAVTEELANRSMAKIPDDDECFGRQLAENRRKAEEYFSGNTRQLEYLSRSFWALDFFQDEDGTEFPVGTYMPERRMMYRMFDSIICKRPDLFSEGLDAGREYLFEMLTKAYFTGNILPFGKLFNDTFGRGAFREFGHLQTAEEQITFLEEHLVDVKI